MFNGTQSFRVVALIALAVLLLPALALATTHDTTAAEHTQRGVAWLLLALSAVPAIIGTVVTTYNFQPQGTTTPVSSTVAPTATQALGFNAIAVLVSMAESDTTAPITHNWGLSANANAQYQPWISWYPVTAGTAAAVITFAVSTNTVTLTKTNAAGSSGSWVVILQRPLSMVA